MENLWTVRKYSHLKTPIDPLHRRRRASEAVVVAVVTPLGTKCFLGLARKVMFASRP